MACMDQLYGIECCDDILIRKIESVSWTGDRSWRSAWKDVEICRQL